MKLALHAASLLLSALVMVVMAVPSSASPMPLSEDLNSLARRAVELTNQERMKAGLLPLKWNDSLAAAGAAYAQELATRNFFGHDSPEGSTPVERARRAGYPAYGWGGVYVGENLARAYPTPEGAMQGWMASEGHRTNLLNPKYREIGVGIAVASSGALVWAQEFGSRPKVLPVFVNGDAPATGSPSVTLSITSEDVSSWGSLGGITQMMVSNYPDFAGSSWEPYARTKAWSLTGEPGLKRVYVRLKDAKGATVESSDDIMLVGRQALGEPAQPSLSQLQPKPEFRLGFKLLASQIPQAVGDPLTDEQPEETGNVLQQTTKGLLVWVKSQNWTAFTNGWRTWVNGPFGVQERSNDERFPWER